MQQRTGTGKGGKSFQDRELASEVRRKALQDIKKVLEKPEVADKWGDYKRQMLLRLATTLLPRLNEVTGDKGGPILIVSD